jgi:predicted translin family RNA/ssDNA-binding protein
MNKLIEAIENIDVDKISEVNKLLRNIHSDILYFHRIKNVKELRSLADLLYSINSNEVDQSWSKRKYYKELKNLGNVCRSLY